MEVFHPRLGPVLQDIALLCGGQRLERPALGDTEEAHVALEKFSQLDAGLEPSAHSKSVKWAEF